MNRYRILLIIAMVAACVLPTASALGADEQFTVDRSGVSRIGANWVETIDMLFDVGPDGILSLGTQTGSVDVRTWSQDKVRMVITKSTASGTEDDARRILETFRVQAMHGGKDVQVFAAANQRRHGVGVKYTIWVPKSYNLNIKTEKGSIELPQINGKFSAHTAEGKITVDCDTEDLDIEVENNTNAHSNPGGGTAGGGGEEPRSGGM